MCTTLLLLLAASTSLNAQISDIFYFPEDSNAGLILGGNRADIPTTAQVNLADIRGTSQYEKYVDQIISGGLAKLTLAINKAFLQKRSNEHDNIVFAPMSIGGALALVLLGSNGRTFQEITSVLGLAAGINVQSKTEQIHEQFGRIIKKLESVAGFDMTQQVNFAHAVFVQNNYPIRTVYKQTAEELYESEILNVDFQSNPSMAQRTINAWVLDRTRGKIRDILADVPSSATKVIIASAMYFKALWEKPFFEGTTASRPFFTNGRKSPSNVEVDMMANGGEFPYYKDPNLKCEIMGFPYKGNATVMYVVMPLDSNTERLKQLESTLTAGDLEHLADSTTYTRAVVLFPKMKIESTIDLKAALEELGLRSLFNPAQANLALLSPGEGALPEVPSKISSVVKNPLVSNLSTSNSSVLIFSRLGETVNCSTDFGGSNRVSVCQQPNIGKASRRITSRISAGNSGTLDNLRQIINQQSSDNNYQNPGLYADKVVHKVYMDITETGTEAAASTSVSLSRDGGRVTFRVDVPFFFFIRHEETKSILFWGSVNTPTPNFRKV